MSNLSDTVIARNLEPIHVTLDTLFELGAIDAAIPLIQRFGRVWETHEYLTDGLYYLSQIFNASLPDDVAASFYLLAGNLSRHQSDYTAAQGYYESGLYRYRDDVDLQSRILSGMAEVAFRQGLYERARTSYQTHYELGSAARNPQLTADALTGLARVAAAVGNDAEGLELLAESEAICQQHGYDVGKAWVLNARGEILRARRHHTKAAVCYSDSLMLFHQLHNPGVAMLVQQNLAFTLLERDASAEKLLMDALRFWQHDPPAHGILLCLVGWSAVLQKARRYQDAVSVMSFAAHELDNIGVQLELGDAHLYEKQAPLIDRDAERHTIHHIMALIYQVEAPPVALTPREQEVLELVAQGLTDREIAERCIISRHTVNAHLRKIYHKLGVNSRTEAVYQAVQHDLLSSDR
jgi:ATP/maltotriose-dependent transcriptional regulator MalT